MQLNRIQFLLILAAFFILPFFIYKIIWLVNSAPATGTMCFMGKSLNGQLSSTYPVIKLTSLTGDTIFFNGINEAIYQRGDRIPVRYQKNNPMDARINQFKGIWLDTIIYAMTPFIMLLIVFLHPDIIPRRSKIIIGKNPFIKMYAAIKK